MEHRWGNRVRANVAVQIFADPASMAWGRLRDISISGGFIETALRVPALSTLRMTAPATCDYGDRVVDAIVVRSAGDGIGVEWFDGNSDAVAGLIHDAMRWRKPQRLGNELPFRSPY